MYELVIYKLFIKEFPSKFALTHLERVSKLLRF